MARILIAGASTRAIAQSAIAAGCDVVTVDYFGDFDQKACCENYALGRDLGLPYGPAGLYEAGRRLRYEAVAYTAGLENHPAIVAALEAGAAPGGSASPRLLGNSPETLARVRDWPALSAFLAGLGFAVPETLSGDRPAPAAAGRWLRKPVHSGGGHRIRFCPLGLAPGPGFVLQQYVPGRACSAAFLANGRDAVLLGLTQQLIGRAEFGAADFAYCGNLYPLTLPDSAAGAAVQAEVAALIRAVTREYGLMGLNGLDFMLDAGRVWPLEINPRYSASMELIERAWGRSLFACHLDALAEGRLPDQGPAATEGCYGKAILYAERDCTAPDTRGWPDRDVHDVPFPGEALAGGSPVCTILAWGADRDACRAALVARAEELKGALYA